MMIYFEVLSWPTSCDNLAAYTRYIDIAYGTLPYTVASHLCFEDWSEDII